MSDGHIFASGGGNEKETEIFDAVFMTLISSYKKPILYIPLALDWTDYDPARLWFGRMLKQHRCDIPFTMVTNEAELAQTKLGNYGAIYLGGGNTYLLSAILKRSGMFSALEDYYKKGGIIYGGSAGGIVLGLDISTVSEERYAEFSGSTRGVGLISQGSIRCHVTQADKDRLSDFSVRNTAVVIGLPETSGIYLYSGKTRVMGIDPVWICLPNRSVYTVLPGDYLNDHLDNSLGEKEITKCN